MYKPNIHLSKTWVMIAALCLLILWVYFFPAARDLFMDKKVGDQYANADFYAYFIAGRAYNLKVDPYIDHRFEYPTLNNPRIEGYSGYIYPPTALPLYGLLGSLPYTFARVLWALLNLGSFLTVFGVILVQARAGERSKMFVIGALIMLTSYPVLTHLGQGQVDMLVCSLSIMSYLEYRQERQWSSAVFLSLAVFIKVNPIVLLATLVLYTWNFKYLLRFGLTFSLLFALSLLYTPLGYYIEFIQLILPDLGGGRAYFTNQSLIRLVAYQGMLPLLVTLGGMISISIFSIWVGFRQRRVPHSLPEAWLVSEAIFTMNILSLLLFSGHSWTMAYVWVIWPVTRLLVRFWDQARAWFLGLVAMAVILINAHVEYLPFFDSQNLIGGILLMLLLLLLLIVPRAALRQLAPTREEMVPSAVGIT
jgi:hypothetical protein